MHSAYKVALSFTFGPVPEASNTQNCKSFWKSLRGLNVSNKIKNFTWGASHNIFPTKVWLCHRKVIDSPICEVCSLETESSGHLFWHCAKTYDIWPLSAFPLDMHGVHSHEFIDLLCHLRFAQHVGNDVLELIITHAWCIWYNRNQVRLGKPTQSVGMIINKAKAVIEEFQEANFTQSKPIVKEVDLWINPKPPWYKVNTDGAVFAQQQASGVGAVI